jgi:tetratricopeptide (TPR) repeat protein
MTTHRLIIILVTFVAIAALATSCKVKKMTRQAEQFEAAGMFKEASDTYYNIVMRKPQEAGARIALRRTGQIYLEELSAEVRHAFNLGKHKEAVYHYLSIVELTNKLGRAGADLKTNPEIDQMYADAKDAFLNDRYAIGQRLINEQEFAQAREIFTEISRIDPNFRNTRNYLSEATHEPVYREGTQLFNEGKFMDAYNRWREISRSQPDYKDIKIRMENALDERYREGVLWLMNEDFDNARNALADVFDENSNFKDVSAQYTIAKNEPVYRRANLLMQQQRCRTAYFDYDAIIADAGDYKDTRALREQALECAQFPVAVYSMPIPRHLSATSLFENTLTNNLLGSNNIFLKVFDLSTIDSRLGPRMVNRTGAVDSRMLMQLNNNHNIKALLLIEHTDYSKNRGDLSKKEQTGFERIVTKDEEGNSKIYDRRVKYFEYEQKNSVKIKVTYKLISTDNAQILLSNTYAGNLADEIKYATYDGNKNILYPSVNNRGTVSIDENGFRRLQSTLNSRTNITTIESLEMSLFKEISGKIARDINNFNPEQ